MPARTGGRRSPDRGPSSAGASLRPHLRVLRAIGFWHLAPPSRPPAPPSRPSLRRRLHAAHCALALCTTSAYALQELMYAYQEMDDMDKLSGVLFVLLCHVTCVAKQLALRLHAPLLDRLLVQLDEPLFNSRRERAARRRAATARTAARLLRAYAGCALATCVLWTAFAVADRLRARRVEFAFWTGFRYDGPLAFTAVLLYSLYATSLVAVGNTTMDALAATVLHQCRTQLANVRDDFESLPERASSSAERCGRNFDEVLYEMFVDCLLHYKKITECCALLERALGAALLVQFGAGGWILCMAAYKIVSLNVLSIEFASTTLFIICILTELLLFCYFGNEVAEESGQVCVALYSMRWVGRGPRLQRALLLVMTRAARPLRPAAGHVVPLTLQTYLTILKSSYSFYAMLRQTKQ